MALDTDTAPDIDFLATARALLPPGASYDACVGCGTCEMMCPTEPASIVVDTELALARGEA